MPTESERLLRLAHRTLQCDIFGLIPPLPPDSVQKRLDRTREPGLRQRIRAAGHDFRWLMTEDTEELVRGYALLAHTVDSALDSLRGRERRVIRLAYGLDDGYPITRAEIAAVLGCPPEEVSRIRARAFRHLRHPSRSRKLRSVGWPRLDL